jgi:hypothetical protein
MNKRQARIIAQKIIIAMVRSEVDSPTGITIPGDMFVEDADGQTKVQRELESIAEMFKQRLVRIREICPICQEGDLTELAQNEYNTAYCCSLCGIIHIPHER